MSLLFVALALVVLVALILLILLCRSLILNRCCKPMIAFFRMLERKIVLNALLRALLEAYFQLTIYMWLGWQISTIPPTLEARLNYLIVIAITAFCLIFPFVQHKFLFERQRVVKTEEFK